MSRSEYCLNQYHGSPFPREWIGRDNDYYTPFQEGADLFGFWWEHLHKVYCKFSPIPISVSSAGTVVYTVNISQRIEQGYGIINMLER